MEKYQVIMQMHEAMCFMDAVPDFVFEAPDERAAMKQAEQIIEHWETGKCERKKTGEPDGFK